MGRRHFTYVGTSAAPGSDAFRALTGQPRPPAPPTPEPAAADFVWVLADDALGAYAGIVAEVRPPLVRVAYACGDEEATLIETWLHADQLEVIPLEP